MLKKKAIIASSLLAATAMVCGIVISGWGSLNNVALNRTEATSSHIFTIDSANHFTAEGYKQYTMSGLNEGGYIDTIATVSGGDFYSGNAALAVLQTTSCTLGIDIFATNITGFSITTAGINFATSYLVTAKTFASGDRNSIGSVKDTISLATSSPANNGIYTNKSSLSGVNHILFEPKETLSSTTAAMITSVSVTFTC